MSHIFLASIVGATILTISIVVKNYWYNDILEQTPSAIFLSIASWLFFVPFLSILGYIAIMLGSNPVTSAIMKIWIVLWIIRCSLVDKFSEGEPGLTASVLLGVAPLIYIYWTYFL
jgi:hypothetical protein